MLTGLGILDTWSVVLFNFLLALTFLLSASVQFGLLSQALLDNIFKTVTSDDSLKVAEHEGQMEDVSKAFWFQAIAYPLELIKEM